LLCMANVSTCNIPKSKICWAAPKPVCKQCAPSDAAQAVRSAGWSHAECSTQQATSISKVYEPPQSCDLLDWAPARRHQGTFTPTTATNSHHSCTQTAHLPFTRAQQRRQQHAQRIRLTAANTTLAAVSTVHWALCAMPAKTCRAMTPSNGHMHIAKAVINSLQPGHVPQVHQDPCIKHVRGEQPTAEKEA
jgi:hypothetical protein